MTAKEVRDIGYLQWRDPWAWMETMKGKRWENLIKQEKSHFQDLVSQPSVYKETKHMEQELIDAQQYLTIPGPKIGCGSIDIILHPGSKFYWKWSWLKRCKSAEDITVQGHHVWYTLSDNNNRYKTTLTCEDAEGHTLWKKSNISTSIAVVNQLCYYIKVTGYFKTSFLCVCNAYTGKNERIIYEEKNKERYINLYRAANQTLYLQSEDPIQSDLWRIKEDKLYPIYTNSLIQLPFGEDKQGEDCVLTRNSRNEQWKANGKPISDWILPNEEIEWLNIITGHVITIHEGAETIWYCAPHKKPKKIFKIHSGVIISNLWESWEGSVMNHFIIKSPYDLPFMIQVIHDKVIKQPFEYHVKHKITFKPLEVHKYYGISKDGVRVPYIVIHEKGIKPKAQFIYVYGSYGSTTPINWPYQNWYPLLKRKWAIVFALVRGGGDIDAAWADAARRENRHVSVDDFEVVIRSSQIKLKLGPEKTVIYGRSAGGLPVGAIVSRFPDGNVVGAAFTEVPYVDVLRTSSNPDLPLTTGEFKEFGNPQEKIVNFKELLSVSPINTLPTDGAPGVFVMSRVGLLDRQVFAYESFKWIQRLRGYITPEQGQMSDPKGKYVTFERNEEHVYRSHRFPRFRAIDLAILNAWADGKLKI